MSLQVWLPLTKDLRQQGLSNVVVTNNGATFNSAGKLGGCYSFSSNAIYGELSNTNEMTSMSGCCWVYLTNLNSAQYFFHLGGISSYPSKIALDYEGGIRSQVNGVEYNSGITLAINTWYHIAVTVGGNKVKWYLNGEEKASSSINGTFNASNHLAIGARINSSTGNTFAYPITNGGRLNDVRIYDHCLSPMEVKQLAQGLILHYPLNNNGWGGENLIPYSGCFITKDGWTNNQNTTISAENNELKVILNQTTSTPGAKGLNTFSLTAGTYTISALIKITNTTNARVYYPFYLENTAAVYSGQAQKYEQCGEYIYYESTFTITANQSDVRSYILTSSPKNGETWYIKWIKLERGSKATPWSPAPSDTLAATMGLNSNIEYDVSGFNNNGTRVGTFTWSSDTPKYHVSQYFLDYTHAIHTPMGGLIPTAVSMSCWVKSSNKSPRGSYHEPLNISSTNYEFAIYSNGQFRSGYYLGSTRYVKNISGTNILDGQWHMITSTCDGTTFKSYVDAVLVDTTTVSGSFTAMNTLCIGDLNGGTNYGNTELYESDVRVYVTALSADDIRSLYQNSAYIDSSGNVYGAVHSEV